MRSPPESPREPASAASRPRSCYPTTGWIVAIVIVSVLVLGGLGVGIYFVVTATAQNKNASPVGGSGGKGEGGGQSQAEEDYDRLDPADEDAERLWAQQEPTEDNVISPDAEEGDEVSERNFQEARDAPPARRRPQLPDYLVLAGGDAEGDGQGFLQIGPAAGDKENGSSRAAGGPPRGRWISEYVLEPQEPENDFAPEGRVPERNRRYRSSGFYLRIDSHVVSQIVERKSPQNGGGRLLRPISLPLMIDTGGGGLLTMQFVSERDKETFQDHTHAAALHLMPGLQQNKPDQEPLSKGFSSAAKNGEEVQTVYEISYAAGVAQGALLYDEFLVKDTCADTVSYFLDLQKKHHAKANGNNAVNKRGALYKLCRALQKLPVNGSNGNVNGFLQRGDNREQTTANQSALKLAYVFAHNLVNEGETRTWGILGMGFRETVRGADLLDQASFDRQKTTPAIKKFHGQPFAEFDVDEKPELLSVLEQWFLEDVDHWRAWWKRTGRGKGGQPADYNLYDNTVFSLQLTDSRGEWLTLNEPRLSKRPRLVRGVKPHPSQLIRVPVAAADYHSTRYNSQGWLNLMTNCFLVTYGALTMKQATELKRSMGFPRCSAFDVVNLVQKELAPGPDPDNQRRRQRAVRIWNALWAWQPKRIGFARWRDRLALSKFVRQVLMLTGPAMVTMLGNCWLYCFPEALSWKALNQVVSFQNHHWQLHFTRVSVGGGRSQFHSARTVWDARTLSSEQDGAPLKRKYPNLGHLPAGQVAHALRSSIKPSADWKVVGSWRPDDKGEKGDSAGEFDEEGEGLAVPKNSDSERYSDRNLRRPKLLTALHGGEPEYDVDESLLPRSGPSHRSEPDLFDRLVASDAWDSGPEVKGSEAQRSQQKARALIASLRLRERHPDRRFVAILDTGWTALSLGSPLYFEWLQHTVENYIRRTGRGKLPNHQDNRLVVDEGMQIDCLEDGADIGFEVEGNHWYVLTAADYCYCLGSNGEHGQHGDENGLEGEGMRVKVPGSCVDRYKGFKNTRAQSQVAMLGLVFHKAFYVGYDYGRKAIYLPKLA